MANYKSIYTGAEIDSAIGKANTALQEHQELKTINNESLVGEGNITIEGTSYTAGENIQISEENVISATDTIYNDTELREAIAGKQEELVSGTNIKTINDLSILGEGNLIIDGQGGDSTHGWQGKVVSILGDSISTFEGYVPVADGHNLTHRVRYTPDNASWYFAEGGTVNDTYWKKLINSLGAKLGINDSWAGSRVSNSSSTNTGDVGPDACMASITRITNLGANGTPDLILYYGGTNDAGAGVTVGSFNSNTTYTTDLTTTTWADFATAYKDSIMRLQYYYPFAKIVVLLPMYCTSYYNMGNLDKYNEQIKLICDYFGVEYIDLRRCGVNSQNLSTMLGDGIHPKVAGFNEMYKYLKNKLFSMYSNDNVENVVYSVTNTLAQNTNTDRYIKGVSAGKSYTATITGSALTGIKVYMGGLDVTSSVYNSTTGQIQIPSVTGNITISEAQVQTYNITTNVTGGTATGATVVAEGGNATVYITPNENYRLPSTITVSPNEQDYVYSDQTGAITLVNVESDITITVVCDEYVPEVYDITVSVTDGTYSGATQITEGSTANVTVAADSGFILPASITVTNASYTYNNVTGAIVLSNAENDVIITVVCQTQPQSVWYTDAPQAGTQAVNVKGYGWALTAGIKSLITGVPINVISFTTTLTSGIMEIGVGTSDNGLTNWTIDSSRIYTINWDSSNKVGNVVTIGLPETITLAANEYIVVHPNTEPVINAFTFSTNAAGYEFTSDVPTSRRGQSPHTNPNCNLQFNFGYKSN